MPTQRPFTVVAFGDSITAANEVELFDKWTSVLERRLCERFGAGRIKVINAGVGGHTSREGLARMEADVLAHRPDLAIVQFGGNDSTFEPLRAISVAEFMINLGTIKSRLIAGGTRKIVIASHPPLIDHKHPYFKHPEVLARGVGINDGVEVYRRLARNFADAHGLPLVDLDAALRVDLDAHMLADGTHLTVKGNICVAEALMPSVEAAIAER